MASSGSTSLRRERALILGTLLLLAGAAWVVLFQQTTAMRTPAMGLTMGMDAALFLAIWIVMMVAMMFPSAAPMILTFAAVYHGRRQRGQAFVPAWVFVGGYLVVWGLFGALAYALAIGVQQLASGSTWLMTNAGRIGGAVIVAAGFYQLSPLKSVCLTKCRTPTQFVLAFWRNGYGGAFRMGVEHGLYCLGCCWLLFVLLFPLGVMNLVVMALLTALIFAEKALPLGERIAQAAAVVFVSYGLLAIFVPALLPGMAM